MLWKVILLGFKRLTRSRGSPLGLVFSVGLGLFVNMGLGGFGGARRDAICIVGALRRRSSRAALRASGRMPSVIGGRMYAGVCTAERAVMSSLSRVDSVLLNLLLLFACSK